MKRTLTVIAFSALIFSCNHKANPSASKAPATSNSGTVATTAPATTTPPPATAEPAKSPEMLGQSTYTAKCGRCHGLKTTTDYTAERWVGIMESMAPKAHLDDTEKQNVLAYVKANAKK